MKLKSVLTIQESRSFMRVPKAGLAARRELPNLTTSYASRVALLQEDISSWEGKSPMKLSRFATFGEPARAVSKQPPFPNSFITSSVPCLVALLTN